VTDRHNSILDVPAVSDEPRMSGQRRWAGIVELPRPLVIAVVAGVVALTGFLNYLAPTDLSFTFYYLAPVLFLTWFLGRRIGYLMAVISIATFLFAELHGAASYVQPSMAYWNAVSRLSFFLLSVALLSSFRNLSTRLGALVDERTKELQKLAAQLSEAEDSERRRLAHDIHDGFGQILSILKLNLATAVIETSEDTQARQRITAAIAIVNDLIDRTRTLTFDLHPAMLDHLGLVPTLRRHAEQFARQTNVEVTVSEDGMPPKLATTTANYLFRSIKELLNNAVKHGQAKQIVAAVHWTPAHARIVIDDDGAGFDTASAFAPGPHKGIGLPGIRERLLSLGGSIRLESSAGGGTRVVLELPLANRETSA
jgi:signal transduction histidine kinase